MQKFDSKNMFEEEITQNESRENYKSVEEYQGNLIWNGEKLVRENDYNKDSK